MPHFGTHIFFAFPRKKIQNSNSFKIVIIEVQTFDDNYYLTSRNHFFVYALFLVASFFYRKLLFLSIVGQTLTCLVETMYSDVDTRSHTRTHVLEFIQLLNDGV